MTPRDPGLISNTPVLVKKGSSRILDMLISIPTTSADVYLQFFDAANPNDVTLGTTAPYFQLRNLGSLEPAPIHLNQPGIFFQNGIVVAATASRSGSDAPSAPAECVFLTE